jgi:hypothetical protein
MTSCQELHLDLALRFCSLGLDGHAMRAEISQINFAI